MTPLTGGTVYIYKNGLITAVMSVWYVYTPTCIIFTLTQCVAVLLTYLRT